MKYLKAKFTAILATVGLVLGAGLPLALAGTAQAATCTPTGFIRDTINLTAAQIGGNVNGPVDATGCDIGVYFDKNHPGSVHHANIFGARYFGVVVDGGQGKVNVNIAQSSIHDVGDSPSFTGNQHGNAIYYYSDSGSGKVTGRVTQNHIYQYQKGGIIVNGPKTTVNVLQNQVNGLGPVDFIAQNGIQVSRGATGHVQHNTVTGNSYTGTNDASSGGILIFGGWGTPLVKNAVIDHNTLRGNDVGVWLANYNAAGPTAGPSTPTKIKVDHNIVSNSVVNNVSGNDYPQGYQAGISDTGNQDRITYNQISGAGYAPQDTASIYAKPIDLSSKYTFAIDPTVSHNLYNGHIYP